MVKRSFTITAETESRLRRISEDNGFKESAVVEIALRRILDVDDVVDVLKRENASVRRMSRAGWMRLFREIVDQELQEHGHRPRDVWSKMSAEIRLSPNLGAAGGDQGQILALWVQSIAGETSYIKFNITDSVYESARTVTAAILAPRKTVRAVRGRA